MAVVDDRYLPLEAWNSLYLAASAAAATLVGLLFVVITLAGERQPHSEAKWIPVYLTPTVVYFALVLMLAIALMFPTQSRLSVSLCCCGGGAAGIAYALSLLRGTPLGRRVRQRGDAWLYSLLPAVAFGLLVCGGATVYASHPGKGLTMVAVAILAMLALALRNSWAIAVSVISTPRGGRDAKRHE